MDSAIPKVWRACRGARSLPAAAALLCVALAGCAAQRATVPDGSELSVAVFTRTPAVSRPVVDSKVVRNDAATGMAGGMVVGTIVGAASATVCGPLLPLCIQGGAVLGGVAGGVAGAGVGLIERSLEERLAAVRDRTNRFMDSHPSVERIQAMLVQRARGRWKVVTGPSPNKLHIDLRDFEVQLLRGDRAQLMLRVFVTCETAEPDRRAMRSIRQFTYIGPELDTAAWIDAADDTLERQFWAAYDYVVKSAIFMLAPF